MKENLLRVYMMGFGMGGMLVGVFMEWGRGFMREVRMIVICGGGVK